MCLFSDQLGRKGILPCRFASCRPRVLHHQAYAGIFASGVATPASNVGGRDKLRPARYGVGSKFRVQRWILEVLLVVVVVDASYARGLLRSCRSVVLSGITMGSAAALREKRELFFRIGTTPSRLRLPPRMATLMQTTPATCNSRDLPNGGSIRTLLFSLSTLTSAVCTSMLTRTARASRMHFDEHQLDALSISYDA